MINPNQNRPNAEINSIIINTLDIYPTSSIQEVNDKITEFFELKSNNRVLGEEESRTKVFIWELLNRDKFYSLIINLSNFSSLPFSKETLEKFVNTIRVIGSEVAFLPFYVLQIRVDINPSFYDKKNPDKLGESLSNITNPIRIFLASLNGMIATKYHLTPPMVTWLRASVSEEELTQIKSSYGKIELQPKARIQYISSIPANINTEKPLFPFVLESMGIIQQRSLFDLFSNAILLCGFSSHLNFFGQRNFYCIVVTDKQSDFKTWSVFDDLLPKLPDGTILQLFVEGISTISSVVALNGWLQLKDKEFANIEVKANSWRQETQDNIKSESIENLDSISKIGLRVSSLASDLRFLKRLYSEGLKGWQFPISPNEQEIPLVGEGPLRYLAADTSKNLDLLLNKVIALRNDIDWIIRNVSIGATISSNKNITELNSQTTKYTRWLMILTILLIILSSALVYFTFIYH